MQIVVDDLLCPTCAGYVHPFLERCPACGTKRAGRYDEALAVGSLGAGALLADDSTRHAAHLMVLRYTLRSSSASAMSDLDEAFGIVAGSVAYRAAVAADEPTPALPAGPASLDSASLLLVDRSLAVRAGPGGRAVANIPLAAVLAATPVVKGVPTVDAWAGVALDGRELLRRRPMPGGDLLVTFAGDGAAGQLAIANRRGLLVPKARPDHYATLARWIGILGAAAAEARWLEVGAAAHAAELGLGGPAPANEPTAAAGAAGAGATGAGAAGAVMIDVPTVPTGAAMTGTASRSAGDGTPSPTSGIRAALEELEGLRAAGLVTDAEYEAKRREILSRL